MVRRTTRTTAAALTRISHRRAFEQAWPEIESSLKRVLAARQVPRAEWDDLIQEVAARALAAEVTFCSPEDLRPWATTVVRRLHIDAIRRDRREHMVTCDVDGGRGERRSPDIAAEVSARLDLAAIAEIVATWPADARRTLLDDDNAGTRQPSAFYVRRHRLRAKLLAAIDGVAGVAARWRGAPTYGELANAASVFLTPVAVACLAAGLALNGGSGGSPNRDGDVVQAAAGPRTSAARDGGNAFATGASSGGVGSRGARSPSTETHAAPTDLGDVREPPAQRLPLRAPLTARQEAGGGDVSVYDEEHREPVVCAKPEVTNVCIDIVESDSGGPPSVVVYER